MLKGGISMQDRIKAVRKSAGLTQIEFGQRIGATRAMITSYERGVVTPSDTILKLIAKEFHVSYDWLKTGEHRTEGLQMNEFTFSRIAETYRSLPERLKTLADALAEMDPEWYQALDKAMENAERRRKGEKNTDMNAR